MRNCMTYALKIEEQENVKFDYYLIPSTLEQQLQEICELFKLTYRKVENEDSMLENGEWLIALFGPFPTKIDYEGNIESYDYHFIIKEEGTWMNRDGKGSPVTEFPVNEFNYFESHGFPPQFFAVRRTEV